MNVDKPLDVAELIVRTLNAHEIPVEHGLPGMSFALVATCHELGLSRESLKKRLMDDIDMIYDVQDRSAMQ